MSVAKAHNLTVRETILRGGGHRFLYDRKLTGQVTAKIFVEHAYKISIVVHYITAITRTLAPDARSGIKTIVGQRLQSPLTQGTVPGHHIEIVLTPLSVLISVVSVQYQRNGKDKARLDDIPIIMRHAVLYYDISHFLQRTVVYGKPVGMMALQIFIKKIITFGKHRHNILVYHLEGSHSYQCLLVPVVQIAGHITVINALQVSIEHTGRQPAIFLLTGQPP